MFEKPGPKTATAATAWWRPTSSAPLALVGLLMVVGCEEKGLGRPCSLGATIPKDQGAYSVNATDCQSRMCVKPALQPGVVPDTFDTGPYCSNTCSSDSDCQGGQMRDRSDPNDKRCKTGFTCAVPFGASDDAVGGGQLCCQKICLCRDFFSASVSPATPATCQDGTSACSTAQRD